MRFLCDGSGRFDLTTDVWALALVASSDETLCYRRG